MQTRRSNADRRQETRGSLLTAARILFLENGYAATATPELVERAGVTRGALYHHFKDKLAAFQGVVEQEAADVAAEIARGSADAKSSLDALLKGAHAYFMAMRVPWTAAPMPAGSANAPSPPPGSWPSASSPGCAASWTRAGSIPPPISVIWSERWPISWAEWLLRRGAGRARRHARRDPAAPAGAGRIRSSGRHGEWYGDAA